MLPARLRLGTSGYAYKDWVGPFYPPGVPQGEWLSFYAQRFDTVEINSTYYRVGPKSSYAAMRAKVGDEFVFSVKAPGDVTHVRREDPVPILSEFFNAIAPLGRGPVLLQFPTIPTQCLPEFSLASPESMCSLGFIRFPWVSLDFRRFP